MPDDNKNAARQAASKFSADIKAAVKEYGKLTGQQDSHEIEWVNGKPVAIISKLQEEMLSLLPKYRYPTWDAFAENMIFIDPDGVRLSASMYGEPEFLSTIKKADIPAEINATIENYIKESEATKLEHLKCQRELSDFKALFEDARQIIETDRDETRSDVRNARVVQLLGLSTGLPPKRIDKRAAYIYYFKLVRKKGLSRKAATEKVVAQHGYGSFDAALKALHDYRMAHLAKYERHHPTLLEKYKDYLQGFVLPRR